MGLDPGFPHRRHRRLYACHQASPPPRPHTNRAVYADWCGPCKQIGPVFERLARENAIPKKVAFVKVNVDSLSSISRSHGVTAMPTFILFHNGKALRTVRGADPSELAALVGETVKLRGQATQSASFASPGRTLGGEGVGPARGSFNVGGFANSVVTFFGLYFGTLLSARVIAWFMGW